MLDVPARRKRRPRQARRTVSWSASENGDGDQNLVGQTELHEAWLTIHRTTENKMKQRVKDGRGRGGQVQPDELGQVSQCAAKALRKPDSFEEGSGDRLLRCDDQAAGLPEHRLPERRGLNGACCWGYFLRVPFVHNDLFC